MKFFLWIYDKCSGRRWPMSILWMAIVAVAVALSTRIHLKEDIGDFLTSDPDAARYMSVYQQIGGQNRIVLITSAPDVPEEERADSIAAAMSDFEVALQEADTAGVIPSVQMQVDESVIGDMLSFLTANAPLLLSEEDYRRADSLLSQPDYIAKALAEDRQMLLLPSHGFFLPTIQHDPLHLFAPVMERLQQLREDVSYVVEDGVIFTPDHQAGIGFITSPYGSSESGKNRELNSLIEQTVRQVSNSHHACKISAVGAPLIAVSNADRIKTDGLIAGILSVVLIGLLLWFVFRRVSDIFWMVLSIATGYAIAIAVMGLYHQELSVIVLGTGSVLIGIAANYPLHFIDHLRHEPNRRKALADMVPPLLTGNITTVSAFACLAWMDSEAMRDLGIMGALVLISTILFVLVFLPILVGQRKYVKANDQQEEMITAQERQTASPLRFVQRLTRSGWFFLAMVFLTLVLGWFSLKTTFDTNLQHINYMTDDQRANVALLGIGLESSNSMGVLAVAESQSIDQALEQSEQMADSFRNAGIKVKGLQYIVPSMASQQQSLERWQALVSRHGESLRSQLIAERQRQGFSAQAFAPFLSLLDETLEPQPFEFFEPVASVLGSQYILTDDSASLSRVVNYLQPSAQMTLGEKADWRSRVQQLGYLFDSSDVQSTLANSLSDDFNYIGFVCGFVVFFFLWLSFGYVELSLMSFLPLAVGWIWILGIMQLCGIQFNIVNIILATFIFGQGDDYTIFITDGLVFEYTYGRRVLRSYRNSVALSALIMFIGIGSLIFARHPAMHSLAEVVIVGMFTVVVMAFYLPPLVFRWLTTEHGQLREVPLTMERFLFTLAASLFYLVGASFFQPFAFLYSHIGRYTERRKERFHTMLCGIARFCINHVPGTTYSVNNPNNERLERPAVIVCNHQSQLDLMAVLSIAPKTVILTKKWVWNNPLYNLILRAAEFYPITEDLAGGSEHLKNLVQRGYSIVIFPEGTRSRDQKIHRFHQGAFHLAKFLDVDILPVFLTGLGRVLPKDELAFRRGHMHMEIGRRVRPDDSSWGATTREMTQAFHRYFVRHYAELCREHENTMSVLPFVEYQYKYKTAEVKREARQQFKAIRAQASEIDGWKGGAEYEMTHCGQGERAFVFALVHPEVQVIATDPDADKIAVANHINIHLPNLSFEVR